MYAGLLARSQYPEGPVTTCLSCSPPDLNSLVTFFFPYLCTCNIATATG